MTDETRTQTAAHDALAKRIIALAAQQAVVDPAEVSPASHFEADLNYDSLAKVEFAMELEDAFGITISDELMGEVQTVGEAIDGVRALVDDGGGGASA